MDFGTMKRKLNAFEYNSYEDCINDIKLVFANSDQYNLVSIYIGFWMKCFMTQNEFPV